MNKQQLIDALWKVILQEASETTEGEILDELCNLINEQDASNTQNNMDKQQLIDALWKLINQDGELRTDGEILDQVCNLLNEQDALKGQEK
jgi:hypothetical protein